MIRLLVTSGHGPAECRIAVAHALRWIAAEAEASDCDCAIAAGHADRHGPACAIVVLDGPAAGDLARRWTAGSVLWMCRSPLRPGHARKNWFIGVIALPPCRTASPLTLSDVRFESFRAGGPGGQHQNKTESAVRAVHVPTGLAAVARDGRSQHRNKALAIARLQALLNGRTLLAESRDASRIHNAHHTVIRGSGGLRFEGPQFRPAG